MGINKSITVVLRSSQDHRKRQPQSPSKKKQENGEGEITVHLTLASIPAVEDQRTSFEHQRSSVIARGNDGVYFKGARLF